MFLPATATTGPKELHAYVSAVDGNVLYMTNRLRTAKPRKTSNDELLWLSLGRGNSLYAGQVPINTAASSNKKNGGPYQVIVGLLAWSAWVFMGPAPARPPAGFVRPG